MTLIKIKMNLYKPFEILFYTIETIWDWTGVGGFYKQVSLVIATFQWLNILTAISLINRKIEFIYLGAIYVGLFIFNWIYFKDKRVSKILQKYSTYTRPLKIFFAIVSLLYFIVSFVLFFLTFGR